jgi:hypothetical protein
MGVERLNRLDAELPRPVNTVDEKPVEPRVPGKRTEIERMLAGIGLAVPLPLMPQEAPVPGRRTRVDSSRSTRLDFEDYRVLGLRHLLHRLGSYHPLRAEVLAAADRTVARRATLSDPSLAQASTSGGQAVWRAAERHAVTLYRHAVDAGEVDEADPSVATALEQRGSGQPLEPELCRMLEDELGISLTRVRVHTDSVATDAALAVRAEAFTVGDDIFFAHGAFAPETPAGRKLLLHELAHVAQARQGRAEAARGIRASRPDDALEREAEGLAAQTEHKIERKIERSLGRPGEARPAGSDPLGARALEARLGGRLSQLFGSDLRDVRVRPESSAATGATKAVTKAGEVHFRTGAYQPGTTSGDWLIAHELAHVVQQQSGSGARVGTRAELEREADRAASRVVRGLPAGIALRAPAGEAYAFSEDDAHDDLVDGGPGDGHGDAAAEGDEARPDGAQADGAQADGAQPERAQPSHATLERAAQQAGAEKPERIAQAEVAKPERAAGAAQAEVAKPEQAEVAKPERAVQAAQAETAKPERVAQAETAKPERAAQAEVAKPERAVQAAQAETAKPERTAHVEAARPERAGDAAQAAVAVASTPDQRQETAAATVTARAPVVGHARAGGAAAPSTANEGGPAPEPAPLALDPRDSGAMMAALGQAAPSRAVATLAQVREASPAAFDAQREEAQAAIPSVPVPTGLPPKFSPTPPRTMTGGAPERALRDPLVPKTGGEQALTEALVRETPEASTPAPTWLPGSEGGGAKQGGTEASALARGAQSALTSIRMPAGQVSTRATSVPTVKPAGAADPGQMDAARASSRTQVQAAARAAAADIRRDFGEREIAPVRRADSGEVLTATLPPGRAEVVRTAESPPALNLPPEAMASIDAEASPALHEKVGAQRQRFEQGKARHDAELKAAHAQQRTGAARLEEDARAKQRNAQRAAQTDVEGARKEWRNEIARVEKDVQTKAAVAHRDHRGKVLDEQRAADRKAAGHIRDAERQAEAEKRKAEAAADRKKEEAQKESGGFLGWIKSKARALIDGIKQAVNFIYDNLRKAVKAVFDAAKRLAQGVIELARKAIVGLIKLFGEVLKGIVKVALAAFPQLRDRLLQRIDQVVKKAEQIVNAVADTLKKGVAALIDFLASTIDKILGLIQDLYNAALTVIGMLVSGELGELFRKIGQLIDSAKTAPGQFETAAYEELLGGDLDEPLSPAELIAAGRTPPAAGGAPGADGAGDAAVAPHGAEGAELDAEELPRPPWSEANVGVDEVAHDEQLDPELEEDLLEHTGGGDGVIDLGQSEDEGRSLEAILGTTAQQGSEAQASTPAQAPAAQPASADGLTPAERAQVKWELMKKGLADWWSKNWPYVIAGGVLAVAGFIVANILTGGAILAALPAIMTAIGYLFAGLTVVQITGHVRDYLAKAWAGDIQGGGKSLAKGLAAGAIELLTWLTFKVGSAALRGAKAAGKGVVKGAQAVGRGTVAVGKGVARGVRSGAQYVIRAGKVLLRGVSRGFSRGVKRLRDLGARLLARTKFKGFRIRLERRWFFLEGRINPWVLIASGEISASSRRMKDSHFLSEKQLDELRRGGSPEVGRLKEYDVRPYEETTAKGLGEVGDGLTGDHVPSRAALIEAYRLKNPGRPVPEALINDEGITVVLKGSDHATLSRTYAGRNAAVQIAEDARDLGTAFFRDVDAILAGLHRDGRLTMEIVGAYQKAYQANVLKGVFVFSKETDSMLTRFIGLAQGGP